MKPEAGTADAGHAPILHRMIKFLIEKTCRVGGLKEIKNCVILITS